MDVFECCNVETFCYLSKAFKEFMLVLELAHFLLSDVGLLLQIAVWGLECSHGLL